MNRLNHHPSEIAEGIHVLRVDLRGVGDTDTIPLLWIPPRYRAVLEEPVTVVDGVLGARIRVTREGGP